MKNKARVWRFMRALAIPWKRREGRELDRAQRKAELQLVSGIIDIN